MKKCFLLMFLILVLTSCSFTDTAPISYNSYSQELEIQEVSLSESSSLLSGKTYSNLNLETTTELFSNTNVLLPILPTEELNIALKSRISDFLSQLDYPFEPKCIDFFMEDFFSARTFTFYISDTSKLFNESQLYFSYNTTTNQESSIDDFLDKKEKTQIFGNNKNIEILKITGQGIYASNGTDEIFVPSNLFSNEKFISVFHPETYSPVTENEQKFIALTFDDGPNPNTTNGLLEFLESRDVKATFFMVGINVAEYPSTVKKVYEHGHDIGIHSYKHSNYLTMKSESVMEDIESCSELVFSAIGKYPYLVRPPYGNIDMDKINNDSYFFVNWNVDPLDWDTDSAEEIAQNALKAVKSGSIILLHDIYKTTCEAVEIIVDTLLEDGYRFVTISEFYDLNGKKTDNKLHFLHGDYNG